MGYSIESQQKLISALTNIGSLAGKNNSGIDNGIEGLGLETEQNKCDQEAKLVKDGLFKVAIMGTFSCGKSTVINALVGSKILPESALPCTAILTFIQYGTDENKAEVYLEDVVQPDGSVKAGECIQMSVRDFQEQYKYTPADEEEFAKTGTVKRFARVKYAVMYCSKKLMEGGVSIIDAPGLEDKKIASDLAMKIAGESQAIIYVVPERGLSKEDRPYIISTFKNCPNNVFFLINKFDLINAAHREDAIQKLKNEVTPVFTDGNGEINTELLNRRCFGVSALRMIDSRTGMTYDKEEEAYRPLTPTEIDKKFKNSWFEPFEKELELFLTTDEKCIAQYSKCFSQMSSTYKEAKKQVAEYIAAFEENLKMDESQKAECATVIADIRKNIKITEATFDNCSLKIQNKISEVLNACATEIDRTWDQDMVALAKKVDLGTMQYMWTGLRQMNPLASKETKQRQMEEFLGKFITVTTEYFVEKVQDYIDTNKIVIEKVVEECQKTLNVNLDATNELFNDLGRTLTSNSKSSTNETDKSWLQTAISLYLGDFSAAFKVATDGKAPWVEYLKKTIFNTVWQMVLLSFVDGGLGVLIAIAIEYMQGRSNKNETVKNALANSKNSIVQGIREQTTEMGAKINKQIAVDVDKVKRATTEEITLKLNDELHKMEKINAAQNDHTFNLESEKKRFGKILNGIYAEASDTYEVVFGKSLSKQQFEAL